MTDAVPIAASAHSVPPVPPAVATAGPATALPLPARQGSGIAWTVALLSLVLAGGAAWLAWQSHQRVQGLEQTLVKRQEDSQTQAADARLAARQAQELSRETAAKAALIDARLNDVASQRTQIDELLQSLTRSRDENLLIDLEAALQMAQQQAALTGSSEPLVAALRTADERLARSGQPRFEPLRRAMGRDLETLRLAGTQDVLSLAQRLDEAVGMVDELPLRNAPPVATAGAHRAVPARPPAPPRGALAPKAVPAADASSAPAPTGWWDEMRAWWQPTMGELRDLVRVSRIEQPEAVLIAPEQAFFLRENLKLKLLNTRLSLLARQGLSVQSDLQDAQSAVGRYFDPDARKTAQLTALLEQLSTQTRQIGVPRPEQSLALLQATLANPGATR